MTSQGGTHLGPLARVCKASVCPRSSGRASSVVLVVEHLRDGDLARALVNHVQFLGEDLRARRLEARVQRRREFLANLLDAFVDRGGVAGCFLDLLLHRRFRAAQIDVVRAAVAKANAIDDTAALLVLGVRLPGAHGA